MLLKMKIRMMRMILSVIDEGKEKVSKKILCTKCKEFNF